MNLGKYASGEILPPPQKKKKKLVKKIILTLLFAIININTKITTWRNRTKQQEKKS